MSPTKETPDPLRVVWSDEQSHRVVHLDIDYRIEPDGGGVAILDVRAHAVFQYANTSGGWWLSLSAGSTTRPLPLDSAVKLVHDYRNSPQFNGLDDACRKHAEKETNDE